MRSFRSDTSQEEGGGAARPKKNAPGSVGPGAARRRTEGCEAGRAPTTPRSKPPTWSRARDRLRVSLPPSRAFAISARDAPHKFLFGPPAALETLTNIPLIFQKEGRTSFGRTPNISEDISERSRSRRQSGGGPPAGKRRVQVCNCLCRRWRCWLSREVEERSRSRVRRGRRVDRAEADHKGASSPSRAAAP